MNKLFNYKLYHHGIRGVATPRSNVIAHNIGVPQGSVFRPLLFNIDINDLHKCTNNFDIINYADATTLISTINKFDNHSTGMNDNINKELRNVHY